MIRIDAHVHYNGDHADYIGLAKALDLRLLNVCVPRSGDAWLGEKSLYAALATEHPERFAWIGGFDPPSRRDFSAPQAYADRVIAAIERDVAAGAVGCKIWKAVGMEIRRPDGTFLMPDDELLDPVYEHLSDIDLPLLAHIAEPRACWQPLDPESPHYRYYLANPQWHMHGKVGFPPHDQLIAARDRIMVKHPRLTVIGAHLGSLEFDIREVAERMDRFPRFAVDTSARTADLMCQDVHEVRRFFDRYRDRILFGTDLACMPGSAAVSAEERAADIKRLAGRWEDEIRYYESVGAVCFRERAGTGLGLVGDVREKFFASNATRWYRRLEAWTTTSTEAGCAGSRACVPAANDGRRS